MIAYYEIVFLSDCCIDALLLSLSLVTVRAPVRLARVCISAFVGGSGAVLFALYPDCRAIVFLLSLIVMPFLAKRHRNYKEYFSFLLVFLCMTAVLGGVVMLVRSLGVPFRTISYGVVPISVGLGGCIVLFLVDKLLFSVPKDRKKNLDFYRVYLSDGCNGKSYEAFYDSGNRVYSDGGDRVIFVSPSVYRSLRGKRESLTVRTAGGVFTTLMTPAELTVRYPDGKNVLYRVKAAKSDALVREKIILHGEMRA